MAISHRQSLGRDTIFGIYIFTIMAFDCIFHSSIHNEKPKEILMVLKCFESPFFKINTAEDRKFLQKAYIKLTF